MRILITGATGMVGCHTAAALERAGHSIRLLVRNPDRIERALGPLGVKTPDHVVGDVTDAAAVRRGLEGCDAVVHVAALLSFDLRRDAEVQHTNVEGTRLVLQTAAELGLDPILHVSSVSALFPPDQPTLTPDCAVKDPQDMYARSKAAAERVARGLQDRGAPVTITYPGGVYGPYDPTVNEGIEVIFSMVKAGFYLTPPSGMPLIDARDIAAAHVAAMQPGRGPRRYMLGGNFLSHTEMAETFGRITGRRIRRLPIPGGLMRIAGRGAELLRRTVGFDPGAVTYESMLTATRAVPCDSSRTLRELGIAFRSADETLRDTMLWMYSAGRLEARHLGSMAPD